AAVAMMFAMTATAFAAPSVTVEVLPDGVSNSIVSELKSDAASNSALKSEIDKAGVNLNNSADIIMVGNLTTGGKVTVAFGKKADGTREVYGIHQKNDGTWEVVKGVALGNGDYSFTFDGNSPVVFALGNKVATTTTKTGASPKTGDKGAVALITVAANAIA
ncbi:MAG: hypothetical protein IIW54_08265, partial [Lachnospiraceae bacterium]|nr:hypothetical protein [Lachnospiraceae bacterium]